MGEVKEKSNALEQVYQRIRVVLTEARGRAWQAINTAMVVSYWEIGRVIVEEDQRGKIRAEYGEQIIKGLSARLSAEFGKGFNERNLLFMRSFYAAFPIVNALRSELSWTHYRLLLRVEKLEARAFYEAETVNSRWSTRELERQIN